MFEVLETGLGLDMVLSLQTSRNDLFDTLAMILNAMGNELFYIALLALVYWAFNRHKGMRLFFSLIAISLVVFILKDLLARPRPFQESEAVIPLFDAEGFGIPSGHTAVSLVVWGYLAYLVRRFWFTTLVVIYVLLQAWGRVYAGVHFPQDVVAGLLVGVATLALYIRFADTVATAFLRLPLLVQIIIPVVLGIVGIILFSQSEVVLTMVGVLVGGTLSASLTAKRDFRPHTVVSRRIADYVIGLGLSVAVLFELDIIFGENEPAALLRVLRYALTVLFALTIWPMLSVRFNLMLSDDAEADATA